MENRIEVPLHIRFDIPDDEGDRLEFYDGADSLFGYAKALKIVSHYLASGDVKFQAPAAKMSSVYILPSKRGSFLQQAVIEIGPVGLIVGSSTLALSAPLVTKFIGHMFRRSGGVKETGDISEIKPILDEKEGDLKALSEAIDNPLVSAHRTVQTQGVTSAFGGGDKDEVVFNGSTLEYLKKRITVEKEEDIKGVVASYNTNSRYGRVFDFEENRTIPFKFSDQHRIRDAAPLTWSLDRRNRGLGGEIRMTVRRVVTQLGETKQYFLLDCARIEG